MSFTREKSATRTWSTMQAEHDLLENTLRLNPGRGYVDTLRERMIDAERKAAFYFLGGIGRGHGRSFALVQANHIIWFDLTTDNGTLESKDAAPEINRIDIPESLFRRQAEYAELILDAANAYTAGVATPCRIEGAVWKVIPEPHDSQDHINEYRFNVFGTLVAIVGAAGAWQAYFLGVEGKRRPADFIVPMDVTGDELQEYLGDLFHENATPRNNEVRRLA